MEVFARPPSLPLHRSVVEYYVAKLSLQGKSAKTARGHLSGIAHKLKVNEYSTKCVWTPRVRQLLRRMQRHTGLVNRRRPVSLSILQQLCDSASAIMLTDYDISLIIAMLLTAFLALLRISEYTVQRGCKHHSLLSKHVNISSTESFVKLLIRSSKTDQWGEGVQLFIGKASSRCGILCPVQAMKRYLKFRGTAGGPLFCWSSGQPVKSSSYSRLFKRLVSHAGLPSGVYSPHSLRSGGCTALAGWIPTWKLKAIGRWKSSCVEQYIKIPRRELRTYVQEMTAGF